MKKLISIQRLGSNLSIQTSIADKKGVQTCSFEIKEVGFFAKVFVKQNGDYTFIQGGCTFWFELPKRKSKLKLIIKENI